MAEAPPVAGLNHPLRRPRNAAAPQRGARTQYWIGTITNLEGPPEEDLPEDADLYRRWRIPEDALEALEIYRYQAEVGGGEDDPNDGLLHIQIFLKTTAKGMRYSQLNNLLGLEPYQTHWEPARDFAAAHDYCGKENTRLIGGVPHSSYNAGHALLREFANLNL